MAGNNTVEIGVTVDPAQAVGGLGAIERGLKGTSTSAQQLGGSSAAASQGLTQVGQAGEGAATGLGKTRQGITSISEQLSVAKTQLGAFIAAQLGLSTVKQVGQIADDYKNLEARIKLATGEGKAFQGAMDGVVGIAQRTNSNLETTGNLFAKLTDAGKSAGLGTQDAINQSLRLTETINQAVQLSGASAGASNAAITQLIQGLQSGVLRGDEFNSVMEQAPRLAKALADGLGVTTGALRQMAETGQLTADTVITSLKGQADTLKTEFATLPATVGRALENLSTSWTVYIGEASKASGTSEKAASAINALSNNLGTVAGYLIDAGQAVAGFTAFNLAQTFLGIGTAAAQAGVATASNTAATASNSVAHQGNAAAAAREALAFKTLAADVSAQAAALGGNTAATVANNAAKNATGAAAEVASVGVGKLAALLSTLRTFTLIGIVTNFKDIGTAIGEGAAKLLGYKDRTEELIRADKIALEIAAENVAMRERSQALLKAAIDKQFELTVAAKTSLAEFDKLTKGGDSAAEAVAKIGKDFDLANVPGIKNAAAVLDKLQADGKLSATQFQKAWSDALKNSDLAVFETQARAALAGTTREAERLAQVIDATLREAVKRTGLDFDVISGGMSRASRSAINDTDAIVKGLDSLKKQGIDTAAVLTASIGKSINTADSQKAIDSVRAQIESLRKTLGDKVTDGLLEQATVKANELAAAINKIKPGIQDAKEAMTTLGIVSDESLKKTAKTAGEAYEFMRTSGKSSARELSEGFAAAANAAIAANNGIAPSWVQAQAGARGFELAVDSAGKTTLRAMTDAANATDGAGAAAGRAAGQFDIMATAAQKAAAEAAAATVEKYSKPKYGSVTGNTREERLAGQGANDGTGAFALREKQRAGTLSADDLKTAEAVLAAAKFNQQQVEQNRGAFSLSGQQSAFIELNSANAIYEQVKALADRGANAAQLQPANAATRQAQPATNNTGGAATPAQTYLVKIDLGNGQTTNVNTSSANDAQALIGALQNAKRAAGR